MKKLSADVCAVTHAGRVRRENEDNYSLNGRMTTTDLRKGPAYVQHMKEPFHLSVCDGMGGESYGELASGIAVEAIAAHASNVYASGEDFSFAVSNCIDDANTRICNKINEKGKRMGTTLAAVYAVKGSIICVNIGDTRIYHYSKGVLDQISFDHTHAQTIVDAGEVSQDNMSRIPDAKRLTRHLGVFPEESNLSPNISVINDADNGDIIMLCSDGLTDYLTDSDITAVLSTSDSPQDAAGRLVRMALERGGKDNITVITAFLGVEETAIFAPRAAAVVGDTDADYEEEYLNSYGSNRTESEENEVSPYANADARAYVKPTDKMKILKIVGIVAAVALVIIAAALLIKAVINSEKENETTLPPITEEITTYYYPTQTQIQIWSESETETETETETEARKTEKSTSKKVTTTRPKTVTTTKSRVTQTSTTTQVETTTAETTTVQEATTEQETTTVQETTTEQESTTAEQQEPTQGEEQ